MLQAEVALSSTHDPRLVVLSIIIAVLAAYTALDLAGRVTAAKASARTVWLIGGGMVMGIGIWSMHFVAMLAFSLPIAMTYDMPTVLLSMLPAIVASGIALFLSSRRILNLWQLLIGGIVMGIGIASMHYIGMFAMRMEADTEYNPFLFGLSVVIAIVASIVALWIAFQLRNQTSTMLGWTRFGSALVMGAAIAGMHYTGMAAANFTLTGSRRLSTSESINSSFGWLGVGIGIATFIILGFTLVSSFVDQRLAHQARLLEQQEAEVRRSQIFTEMTFRIRRSLRLEDVLNTTVNEVRQALKADRVIIYRFKPDWSGTIIAESVAGEWTKTIGTKITNPIPEDYMKMYKNGEVHATSNVHTVGYTDFHQDILKGFQIKANLVAPILNNNQLIGLLCVHHCSKPRYWQKTEVELFRQLSIQAGIALEQASLLDELQQAQKVLRLRDRAIAAASNAIFISDPHQQDNPIIFCNPAFEKITGYSPEEALGCNYQFLLGADTDPTTVERIRDAVRDTGECQVAIRTYRKDGTPFWCELTISPVRDTFGRVTNFIGVLSDITLRKQVEEELRFSKEALQGQLLELIHDVKEVSNGDLTVGAKMTAGEIGVAADFLNTIIEKLRQIVIQVKQATYQVNISVGENSNILQQLANEALQQIAEITSILEDMDKLTVSLQEVGEHVQQAAQVVDVTHDTAQGVGRAIDKTSNNIMNLQQIVIETVGQIKDLSEITQTASSLISVMDEIDRKTNLLAINAGVEAAWMGEQGRGFTSVAEEISQLLVQSAEVTQQVQQIFNNIQLETREVAKTIEQKITQIVEGANLVKDTKLSIEQILETSHQMSSLMQSISSATVLQSQVSQAVVSLMRQVAKSSEHTADSSRVVSGALQETIKVALQLQESVSEFKTGV
ncbi:MAG: MHYT domain-containing protein [Scytonema sp. PMC 1069.18]|nr:MHYT domain-containing protein [Scytonema sp. PMC 1069.18]MEC4884676.1 MHYT domain-containing protein [Scytonema sp. PMC 1070.18]